MILLSIEERRTIAVDAIRANPERSDRRLARETGVHRETITKLRERMVARGEIRPPKATVGLDGKSYRTKRPGRARRILASRLATLRRLTSKIDDEIWREASANARELFVRWADQLADAAGKACY